MIIKYDIKQVAHHEKKRVHRQFLNGPFGCPENWKQLEREFKLLELGI